jgi:hypothetical protein
MSITSGHHNPVRPFRNSKNKGGSKKGKAFEFWPFIVKVIAHAKIQQRLGSEEKMQEDRKWDMTLAEFKQRVDSVLPGYLDARQAAYPHIKSKMEALLWNRVYKMYWNNKVSRKELRGQRSKEHWRWHDDSSDELRALHDRLLRGDPETVEWKL